MDLARQAKSQAREKREEPKNQQQQQRGALSDRIAQLDKDLTGLEQRRAGKNLHGHVKEDEEEEEKEEQPQRKARKPVQQRGDRDGGYDDSLIYLAFPKPFRRNPRSRRIQITLVGWCILAFIAWFVFESTMCDYYCHPLVAEVCAGNCLKPDAPEFPFVIPTMLSRWLHLDALMTLLVTAVLVSVRFILQVSGLWDGFVDDVPPTINNAATPIVTGVGSVATPSVTVPSSDPWASTTWERYQEQVGQVNWDSESISMEEDEYIYV